jgi:hypothetical protein
VVATVADSVELAGVDCVVVGAVDVFCGNGVDNDGFVVDARECKHSSYEQQQMREMEALDASQSNGSDAV